MKIGDTKVIGDKLLILTNLLRNTNSVLYSINYRPAGWGITFFEENRVKVKEPKNYTINYNYDELNEEQKEEAIRNISNDLSKWNNYHKKRMEEGLITYGYRSTLENSLDFEIGRIKREIKRKKEKENV